MRIYLQALDYEIWEVVCDGPFIPLTKNEFGEDIPKPSREWNELEKRKASLNSKAMNALFCALDKKEFHRVSSCESANEIWHKLEVVYEGTNQVKESKISRYTRQYELFQMKQNESVYSMYPRFTDIVNTLGKTFSNSKKVKKIIRSLLKEWKPKRTAIEEAKDLNTLPLDDLIGSLISYEEDLVAEKGHEEKKKIIALKASKYESDGESEPNDEELAMLARRFIKFFKKTGELRNFRIFKNQREKKEVITCYECKKPDHIRSECPFINKLKKKAMVATWDDSEEASSDEEGSQEVSNLALMVIGGDDDLNEGLKKKKNKWYLDSGCSRHMTGNYAWFSSFTKIENGGDVSFGDNSKGKILGIGNVGKVSSTLIENILFVGNRCGNVYIIDIECAPTLDKFFSALHDDSWLWHRRPNLNKTPYELWKDRKPNIGYFKVFRCKCFILNKKDNLGKFDSKFDVGIFLGYSNSSKAYRVYNKRTLVVEESMHVTFDESSPSSTKKGIIYDDADGELQEESSKNKQENAPQRNQEDGQKEQTNMEQHEGTSQALPKEWRLKQALRAWYDRLKNFLLENDFSMGKVDTTLFVKHKNQDILIVQIYVDDVIFGSTNELLCKEFSSCMSKEFEMSMMGQLKCFLGLQIKQNEEEIFINQAKYVRDLLKRFSIDDSKTKNTPMSTTTKLDKDEKGKEVDIKMYRDFNHVPRNPICLLLKIRGTIDLGLWYPRGTHIDLTCYSDADFAGYKVDRKSTSGTCYILGHSLVSWFSKKQNSVALSTTEAEYIAARSCCAQALWMKQTLRDYGINLEQIPIKCDNTSAINLSKNPTLEPSI
ncbi:hypothetical protein KPL70_023317 [Citrus sinensis]|nr:hypothetical protein KPL70_023317 [Citrus sinensis]